ncbi:MAG TPA: carboxypeptidase regulatory-like domain-containing protein [Terriglobales bacterium]|nr:carboxypeptidase regulatory-like domain-containing protein [Terriglobales bacterium]
MLLSKKLYIFVCLLISLFSAVVFAQVGNQASVEGTVTDPSGAVVPNVAIKLTNTGTGAAFTGTSNESGYFRFPVIPVGSYELTAQAPGFAPYKLTAIDVAVGAKMNLPISLAVVGQKEAMLVTGEVPLVETTRTRVSATVDDHAVADLPVNGRNFMDFVLLTPAVVKDVRGGDLSFGGQRGTLNSLTIDGTDNNNTFFGQTLGRTGSGRAPYQFSEDAVQEFQVNTNGYSAELGRAGGAITNVVTKSGSNTFHGAAFEFFRDRGLNASDPIYKLNRGFALAAGRAAPVRPGYHYNQFGGNLGGPIKRDKLFFFFDYDGQRNTFGESLALVLPAGVNPATFDSFQTDAYNYLLARANSYNATFNQNVYLAKLDYNLSSRNQFSMRYNAQRFLGANLENSGSVTSGSTISTLEHTGASDVNTDTGALQWTGTVRNNLINVARFSYQRDSEPGFANSNNPEAIVQQGGQTLLDVGRNSFSPRETTIRRQQYSDTVSWVQGSHTIKFGADILHDLILNFFPGNFSGSYTFVSLEDFGQSLDGLTLPATSKSFLIEAFPGANTTGPRTTPNMLQTGAFFQDDWRVNSRLTLNLGLRYDRQTYRQPSTTNPVALADALNTGRINIDNDNLAPRIGLAYSPFNDSKSVFRAGWGIFYGNTPSILIGTAHSNNGINVQTLTFSAATMPAYPNNMCGAPAASPSCAAPAGGSASPPTIYLFKSDYQQPMVQQYNLQFEHQLSNSFAFTIGYLGVRGTHLTRTRDINLNPPSPTSITLAGSPSTVFTYLQFPKTRPIAGFSRIFQFEDTAHSAYHGLIATVNKRFSQGFSFGAAYTWSHAIDDAPDATAVVPGTDDAKLVYDPLNPRADLASSLNDVRHHFVFNGTWDSTAHTSDLPRVAKALLGGWEISGIITAQSGQPYTAFVNTDLNNDGNRSNERVPGSSRNTYRLPSIFSVDPRITRNIRFTERFNLKLIAEAFNILNRQNITSVRTTLYNVAGGRLVPQTSGASAFGLPTNDIGPRILQLAAKFVF